MLKAPDRARAESDARGPQLRHISLHIRHAVVAGDGDAVVSVLDKVGIAQLVQTYRRKRLIPVECQIYALPPLSRRRLALRNARVKSQSTCSFKSIRIISRLLSTGFEPSLGAEVPGLIYRR